MSTSRSSAATMIGSRPMNSGIMPNLIRSSVRAIDAQRVLRFVALADVSAEAQTALAHAAAHDLLDAVERARADEQDVGRVDLDQLLLRAIARAVGRDRRLLAFENLEQRLLHAFARHVAGDRRSAALARDLVDLVDADDAAAGLLGVVAGVAVQRLDDAVDVFADVAGLGQRGRVRHRERHVQLLGQRLHEQRLPAAGRSEQQDVALLNLDLARLAVLADALVVVVAPRPTAPSSRGPGR